MTTAKRIKQMVANYPYNLVFMASDLDCDVSQREAAARALQRMAARGEISKLSNGRYFKPLHTIFGELQPTPLQIAKEYLSKDGKTIGYLTGWTAFSRFSLTTQISSEIQIGTNQYRRPLKRGKYKISFVVQPNPIREGDLDLLRVLDCLRFIKEIPGTTPNDACKRIICLIKEMDLEAQQKIAEYALNYSPAVRALLGAILENIGTPPAITDSLRQSLNGVSKYRLSISKTVLPNKSNWRIHAPAH